MARDDGPIGVASVEGEEPVLEARHLTKHYRLGRGKLHAVEDVSLQLFAGHVTGLVGESGSGKSTVARLLAQLDHPTTGSVVLNGKERSVRSARTRRDYTGAVQLVFQDPFASLDPLRRVRHQLIRPLRLHGAYRKGRDVDDDLWRLLERVQLAPADQFLNKYPHELSGGQRQRIAIGRALAARPQVLLADEPVSMLDVSIRLGVLNLLRSLKEQEGMSLLYITHDIASARYFADDVLVMYAGELVEGGEADDVTQRPAHPYTRLLISSAPSPARQGAVAAPTASVEPPLLINPPPGCRFAPRCPQVMNICRSQSPARAPVSGGHWARCWLYPPASEH